MTVRQQIGDDVTAAPRRRRLEPDERREQILACAVHLFGERPYAAVSTTELAARAGVARAHHDDDGSVVRRRRPRA